MIFVDDLDFIYAVGLALLASGLIALGPPLALLIASDFGMMAKDVAWLVLACAPAALIVSMIVLFVQRRLDQK